MKARTKIVFATWTLAAAWLGCNAILGNESAEFVPDAGPAATVTVTAPPPPPAPPPTPPPPVDAGPCDGLDLQTNAKNCGACGHDCLGGGCSLGSCQPVVVATDTDGPYAVALDDTYVYWSNLVTGDVLRAPLAGDGGAPELIFDGPFGTAPGRSIALDGNYIYFDLQNVDGGVARCPKTGCGDAGAEMVVPNLNLSATLGNLQIVDGGTLVFTESGGSGRIGKCQLPSCPQPFDVLTVTSQARGATYSNGVTFFSSATFGIERATAPDASTLLVASASCNEVKVVGSELLFVCSGTGVNAIPLDGGTLRRLYNGGLASASSLAVDDTYAYTNDYGGGRVLRCPVDGGCGAVGDFVATNQKQPTGVAVDAKSIVWANQGSTGSGTIMRLAK